jgi:hypothetical protein
MPAQAIPFDEFLSALAYTRSREGLRKSSWSKLVAKCQEVSAAEEGMTVEEYAALNERRLKDPFCG